MVAISTPAETRTLLENISWQTFKAMLADMGSSRNTRLTYENGTLEILTPSMAHENSNRVIEGFVVTLCEEIGKEYKHSGCLTFTRDDLERCGEAGSSYYIKNEYRVRNKEKIDLNIDLPPDLVLEVEQSPTFAQVTVKEIPRFIQETRINGEMTTTRAFRAWVREQV